ncbi:MAG: endonuclease MutS2 [Chloroflexota bacterium]
MIPKSIEFNKVLNQVASFAVFSAGAEAILDLSPAWDLDSAQQLVAETEEARQLISQSPDFSVGGARDVRQQVERASLGQILYPNDLLDIQQTLSSARRVRSTLSSNREMSPLLWSIAKPIQTPPELADAISRSIDDQGNILDSASDELARIRRELRIFRDRVKDRLDSFLRSDSSRFLQEPILSQRGGRWVVPVQSNFKGKVPGIVHDQSASGATIWVEPLFVVNLNNKLAEIVLAEEQEVEKILYQLSNLVAEHGVAITLDVEVIARIDSITAKARYADATSSVCPRMVPRTGNTKDNSNPSGATVSLLQVRHPLIPVNDVVPINVVLDSSVHVVVLTGPNTGGKTVALKTIGLMVLMAQSGLHLPCEDATLSVFSQVFADIGDEQSIEQNLSTFSGHMTQVIQILEQADSESLVLLDELGAGTDPSEGSALARAILIKVRDYGCITFIATHYPELKLLANETEGVTNASVEFDLETLAPTYRLRIGLAGRSNAFAIAERLGLNASLLSTARAFMSETGLRAEDMLESMDKARRQAEEELEKAQQARERSESVESQVQERLKRIDLERLRVLQDARIQADNELEDFRREIRQLRRRIQSEGSSLDQIRAVEKLAKDFHRSRKKTEPSKGQPAKEGFEEGDKVWINTLQVEGEVLSVGTKEVQVQIGGLRTRAAIEDLELRERSDSVRSDLPRGSVTTRKSSVSSMELDIRGERVADALDRLDRFLDNAFLANAPFVRIIHGKGTGRLRQAVKDALRHHPHITHHEDGKDGEGGWGVTVARFVSGD